VTAAILVTGGAGYIGSHVCQALRARGFLPVSYDNLSGGHEWAVQWGPLIRGDLHDAGRLDAAFSIHKPAAVIHLASSINVRESQTDPGKYYYNNVLGTLSLLEAMKRHGATSLLFSSTASVYGAPRALPMNEEHATGPLNPYGKSKLMVEEMLKDYETSAGIRALVFRYFNACGADPAGRIGEAHDPETHLIPLVIQTALGLRTGLIINGDDHPTPDGTAIRDYIHVSDLADAHVKGLEWLSAHNTSRTLNLGTGTGCSIRDVLAAAETRLGRSLPTTIGPRPPSDPPALVADASAAAALLHWRPRFSDLDTIMDTAWRWHNR
jgi:UDP-arabinose 4-epimerase